MRVCLIALPVFDRAPRDTAARDLEITETVAMRDFAASSVLIYAPARLGLQSGTG